MTRPGIEPRSPGALLINKNKRTCHLVVLVFQQSENKRKQNEKQGWLVGWVGGFYGISTLADYLTLNPFLYK